MRQPCAIAGLLFLASTALAQDECSVSLRATYPAAVTAEEYTSRLIVQNLTRPRGIIFDKNNNLLVIDRGVGIKHMAIASDDNRTCITFGEAHLIHPDTELNHGIEFSPDGNTLYASTVESVYSWDYNPSTATLSNQKTLITNMSNSDHVTRTLFLSRKHPDLLVVSRGSAGNIDMTSASLENGISQIRAFNLSAIGRGQIYNYPADGFSLGWGLRNSVGIDEHPVTGGIWSVENSADSIFRLGLDIHNQNPGEELNYHGTLDSPPPQDPPPHYGYPHCYALFSTDFPELGDLTTGSQFGLFPDNSSFTDEVCNRDFVAPRITFPAHMAPLDIKFDREGRRAYVTFHGSWNRDDASGYKLASIEWGEDGEPVASSDSQDALRDVLANRETWTCPGGQCFRPAGLAWDRKGRLFMTSDHTGELYVIRRNDWPVWDGEEDDGGDGPSGGGEDGGDENAAGRREVGLLAVVMGLVTLLMVV